MDKKTKWREQQSAHGGKGHNCTALRSLLSDIGQPTFIPSKFTVNIALQIEI